MRHEFGEQGLLMTACMDEIERGSERGRFLAHSGTARVGEQAAADSHLRVPGDQAPGDQRFYDPRVSTRRRASP